MSERAADARRPGSRKTALLAAVLGAASFTLFLAAFSASNDHFGRISPGRQIARYGQLPFRDFFDPGYFATELSSAAMQRLFGDNLLGEGLLTASFVGLGAVVVFLLALRLTSSHALGAAAALFATLSMPRPYDYDKFLFYPLALWCAWRYIERRRVRDLAVLALTIVSAAAYRYDNGVFVGLSAIAGLAVVHAGEPRMAARRGLLLAGLTGLIAVPILLFLQMNGGLATVADQVVAYGYREGMRTRLTALPTLSVGRLAAVEPASPPPDNIVFVRWAASVDQATRSQRAETYGLTKEVVEGPAADRTFRYAIVDPSTDRIRALVNDPQVEDTGRIDRGRFALAGTESRWMRLQREWPILRFRVLPDAVTLQNAGAYLFYICVGVPLAALVLLWRQRSRLTREDAARIASLAVLCIVIAVFILREPIAARVGGAIGPLAVLAAWLLGRMMRAHRAGLKVGLYRRFAVKAVAFVLVVAALCSISATGDWERIVIPQLRNPIERTRANISVLAAPAATYAQLPSGRLADLVRYVHECTRPTDFVFASWFVPELYFFAQRGFAGGLTVVFGEHWSEERFQRRTVELLMRQSVPLVIVEARSAADFAHTYPLVDRYFRDRYRVAAESDFGDPESGGYRVLAHTKGSPSGAHQDSSLPCFR